MPNWVTNKIFIQGNPKKIKEIVGNEYSQFSFNKILPRPKELKIDGNTDEQLFIYMTNKCERPVSEIPKKKRELLLTDNRFFTKPLREIYDDVKDYPRARMEKEYELGAKKYQNIIDFGAPDWNFWCDKHWGTKWETHDASICWEERNEVGFRFQTAWVFPAPIIKKLSKGLKTKISCLYTDEDLGLNCGFHEFNNGKHTKEWFPRNELLRVLFSAEIEDMGEYIIEDLEEWENFEESDFNQLEIMAMNLYKYIPSEVYQYLTKTK